MIDVCKFCGIKYRIEMYTFKCTDCDVEFIVYHQYLSIRYNLHHPVYKCLVMDLTKNHSTLWEHAQWSAEENDTRPCKQNSIVVPYVKSDTLPKDIWKFAERMIKVEAFG